jgi:3-oxoacyl-[acyl-carrier-protein] synthase II
MTAASAIAITGIGMVTAAGSDRESTWQRLVSGISAIGDLDAFDASGYATKLAAEAHCFNPAAYLGKQRARRLDRCHQMAIVAAREAVEDAKLDGIAPGRVAVIIGSSLSGTIGGQEFERRRIHRGRMAGRLLYDYLLHACVEHLTVDLGFRGPRAVFSTACTASTIAIAYAVELLRSRRVDAALTGGVDPLAELSFAGFSSMNNVSPSPCAPFSRPIGLTLGEGASMLILERQEEATRRGARVRARIAGYGLTADAYHATSGDPTGRPQVRAARIALAMASVSAGDVDYVNAHGTGTSGNDPVETRSIRLLLGDRASRVPVSSLKGALGHTLGAAGAIEAAITALAIERQVVPPTANFTEPRSGCDLDYVPNRARAANVQHALTFNFAFGGNNAVLALCSPEAPVAPMAASPNPRVVVTGLGIVSPIGIGIEEFRDGLLNDRSGIAPITRFDTAGTGSAFGASINNFAPAQHTAADLHRTDRIGALTVCAADLALSDAGIRIAPENQERVGLVVGTANGPLESCRRFFEPVVEGRHNRTNAAIFANTVVNAAAGVTAMHLRIKGPNIALSAGHAGGVAAICVAYDLIRSGAADAFLCGGVDELECSTLQGYAAAKRIAPHERRGGEEVCAPFDRRRSGLVLGEGSVFLMIESLDNALARSARIYAEVTGWAGSADRPVVRGWDPSGDGVSECVSTALDDAGLEAGEVDVISATAMSHPLHDALESRAIRHIFGARRVPLFALTSRVGMSAATAPLSVAAIGLGMVGGFSPTGVARRDPDPECDVDLLEGRPPRMKPNVALVNAAALGGTNYSLVLRRWAS